MTLLEKFQSLKNYRKNEVSLVRNKAEQKKNAELLMLIPQGASKAFANEG
jgi:hypothetical protein